MEKIPPAVIDANEGVDGIEGSRVLVSGGSGAVGRYLVDALRASGVAQIVLIVRDPAAARVALGSDPSISFLAGDLEVPERIVSALPPVDAAILGATAWDDGDRAWRVNVDGHAAIARALRRGEVRRVVWLGTASILSNDGTPLTDAERIGTPYIASKAIARRVLRGILGDALTIVHPTLVVGGGEGRPATHVSRLFAAAAHYAWLARMISAEGALHLVHAADLARLTCEVIAAPRHVVDSGELVAGAPAISVRAVLDAILSRRGSTRLAAIDLSPRRLERLARLLRIELSPWDRHCIKQRDFQYRDACLTLRGPRAPLFGTAAEILASIPA